MNLLLKIYHKYDAKKALCECEIKINFHLINEIIQNKDKLINIFFNITKLVNLDLIKCTYLLFTKEGFKYNIGSYIILFIILTNIILLLLYLFKGKHYINKDIEKINIIKINTEIVSNNKDNPPKIKKKKRKINKNKLNIIQTNGEDAISGISKIKLELKNIDNSMNKGNIDMLSLNQELNNKKISKNSIIEYNDYELNDLIYEEAIKIDKRNFFEYYFSLLKRKHLLLFTFYPNNDYNLRIIKISLFLFSFSLNYTVNALFFNDKTMHKIYIDEGIYNFIFQIAQIMYSTFISSIILLIIKFLSLSEKDILKIKEIEEKDIDKRNKEIEKIIKRIMIKYVIFFTVNFILLIFFWPYLGSFGAVYRNTQSHLIKDTLTSLILSLIYPFILCLLPAIVRIPDQKNKKFMYMYKISKILQLI